MIRKRRENDCLFKLFAIALTAAQVSSFAFPGQQSGQDDDQQAAMNAYLQWGEKARQGSEMWRRSFIGNSGSSSSGTQREMNTRSFSGEGDASYYKSKSVYGSKSYSSSRASSSSKSIIYNGGCSNRPNSPINGIISCSKYSGCQAECNRNFQFPNGERELIIICKDGEWQIEGTEWEFIPPCEPICLPACQNKGICVAPNMCNCPDNFRGAQCQYESKPCLNMPPPPANSKIECSPVSCSVQCAPNHQFPDGSILTNMVCKDGNWVPSRPDWVTVPNCEVICTPPCQNGGICLSFNMCQCPQDFRGQQCQYSADNCSPQKLGFNGGYNCTSSGTSYTCSLSCPSGAEFESLPVPFYSCDYATGIFSPSPIPQCKFGSHFKAGSEFGESSFERNSTEIYGIGMFKKGEKSHDVSLGVIPQTFIPDIFVVEEEKPRSGSCFTWGSSHYKTFDGKVFDFTSSCLYTFVRDASDNTFSVSISNNKGCDSVHGCHRNITVFLEDKEYVLAIDGMGDAIMALNGFQRIAIPSKTRDFTVESVGNLIILNLHSCGVTIRWNTKDFVQVDVTEKMWNKTAGLCGRFDGHTGNDFEKIDGSTPSSILEFANSWEVHELGVDCTDSPSDINACAREPIEDATLVSKAEDFCQKLLINPKFAACRKVVNALRYFEACKWDYCACEKSNPIECGCQSISVYVQECIRNGVKEVSDWRDEMTCPIACKNGKIYSTCGPAAQATCGTEEETVAVSSAESTSCIEGCFCPSGTVLHAGKCIPRSQCPCQLRGKQFPPGEVIPSDCNTCSCTNGKWVCTQVQCGARCASIGDPHYTTFDGRHYNFMGKCSYYLLKGDNYSIEAENVACAGSISEAMNFPSIAIGLPSCTKMITIHHNDKTIKLKQNREVSINGEEIIKVPLSYQGIHIRMVSSLFLLVELPNGLEVWWDGMTRAYVDAPAHLHGKTKGLCGTFNQNQKDDFLTPEGDVEQSAISFANKWKTSESCADLPEKFLEKPCDVNIHKKAAAESHCQKLKGNIFQICHWLVDPEPYYQDCLYDLCSCEGKIGPCLCPILSAYAKECAKQGLNLDWRMEIRECGIHCPGNQRYQVCGNTCTRSCFDISSRSDDTSCKRKCAEGCNCPEGETLNSRGECIPISGCPCLHQGLEFQPGHKLVMPGARDSQLCVCKNALWDCHHATPQDMKDYPSVDSLRVTCSAANNEEFTDCEPVEPVTCKNMHKPPSYSSAKCTTGCKCKKGYVLDTYSKKCIKPSECPCHHGGRSYGESEKIQEDCNTCTCSSGKWNCTESVCAGVCTTWGESHFKTFDGRIFDFHGSCDYILAKGKINKQDSFEVMIQNVPCGSSGIACSKSVTLKVGSGDKAETITFSKDQGLPPYGGHKRITVRQAGLFVFAEVTDIGIVLQWDKGTRIYVKANPSWQNKIRGLCGNYNDNELDDFMTPSGGISEISPVVFGDSWKVHEYCPEPFEVKDTCAVHPSRKVWALQKCGILKSEVFQPCHSEVPLDPYLERCIFDTCGCDMGGDCECLCTAVAAYAQECNTHGVPIRWRSQELCPMQCDETCAHYSPCVQTCPQQTCDNQYVYKSLTQLCNEDSCVEGCELKPCPEGEVYLSLEDLKCVPLPSCKTVCMTIGNQTFFEGDKIEGDDCFSCYCSRHEKICKGKPCPTIESTTLEYETTMYVSTPISSTTLEHTTAPPVSSTIEETTVVPGTSKCVTGWSPWISNDEPQGLKKPTDVEEITTISSHLVRKYKAICEPEHMKKIECRVVGDHTDYKATGQNVLCSLENGLICDPLKEKGKIKPCFDYEIRVYCVCEPSTSVTTATPARTPVTLPSLPPTPGEVCITGWSPWFSNDRPVRFSKKFNDIEKIPDRIIFKPDAYCERSQVAKIECRTVGLGRKFDETDQNVTCNTEKGLVCQPTEGSLSCLNYEIRVFCQCEPTTSVTTLTTERTLATLPSLAPTPGEVCITGWSNWFSNDRPVRFANKYTDIETIPDRVSFKPEAFCEKSKIANIECRATGTGKRFDETGQNVRCNIDEGLVCNPSKGGSCLNYEIRVYCLCETTTITPATPARTPATPVETTVTPGGTPVTLPSIPPTPGEVCITGWSNWFSNDRPVRFANKYTDIETIPDRVSFKPEAFCEKSKIANIECRATGTGKRFDETGQNVRCNVNEGLVCNPSLGGSPCLNYEIRVYCLCETTTITPATPARTPATPVETSATPGGTPVTLPSLAPTPGEVCITGWSNWFSNDRPVRFANKYTDIEIIPDRVSFKPEAFCEKSKIANIECRATGTGKKFDETGQNVRCNIDEGLVCNPSKGGSCLNYEIRVYCLCETTTITPATPARTPATPVETSATPGGTPVTLPSLAPTPGEVCITGWSNWFSNDRPVRFANKYTDIEIIPDRVSFKPEAFCEKSKIANIECRATGTGKKFDETGQNVRCNIDEGLVCNPSKGGSCLNYEIRVYCLCETTTITPATPARTPATPAVTSATPGGTPVTLPSLAPTPGEVCITGWSNWFSNDRPVRFANKYTDIETIPDRVSFKPEAFCEKSKIANIECRTVGTGKRFDETGQNVRCNVNEGLVCNPSLGGSPCLNYEIRVYCLCEPEISTEITPSTEVCEEGLGMESGAIKDDQISVSSISSPGHLGNHARLNGDGAWIPESSVIPNEWIQVNLLGLKEVTGVIIQGSPSGRDWVKTFEVKWSEDGDIWNAIRNEGDGPPKEFQGNHNALNPKKVLFDEPVFAQYIKIIPTDFHNRISLRLEILGCDITEPTATTPKVIPEVTPGICDPAKPNRPHVTDCYIFYHCTDTLHGVEMVEKTCGPNMMYNPETQTCDWPETVMRIRPDCSGITSPPTSTFCEEGWTEWINVTNPRHGNGDYETLINIRRHLDREICGGVEHISDIQCRYLREIPRKSVKKTKTSTKSGGKVEYRWEDYKKARQLVVCKKNVGLSCNNYEQRNGLCMDYSVRFNCRCVKKVTIPTDMETKPTSPAPIPVCPPGKVWKDCAIKCNQVCLHFDHILSQKGFCSSKYECISGCVDEHVKTCPKGFYWRDYGTCLEVGDCTCVSHSGQPVKPGDVVRESDCELCQCENNVYTCTDTCETSTVKVSTVLPNKTTPAIYTVTQPTSTIGTGRSLIRCNKWTEWQDESNPEDGEGDFESVETLKGEYSLCTHPSVIECVTVTGNIPFSETGNEVTCTLESGLQCYNRLNAPEGCEDYKIRIFCPCETTDRVTSGIVTTPPTTGPTLMPKPCDRWSDWINDDAKTITPGVEHEHKTPKELYELGFCQDGKVVNIECKDVKTGLNYDETVDVGVTCTLEDGLLCRDDQQGKRHKCRDYKIRYFCSCGETTTKITTIITSSVTPPSECDRERFIPLINGPYPLSDAVFSASSSKSPKHGPQSARLQSLYSTESGIGWIPAHHNKDQFLQVDLGKDEPIYGIKVQGSEDVPDMHVTSYHVLHSEDGHKFKYAEDVLGNPKLFRGPVNNFKPIEEVFVEPFEARYVRINPQSWKNGIAVKLDLIGCGEISTTKIPWTEITTPEEAICRDAMGLESGLMKDEQIEVSSVFNEKGRFDVPNIRLNKLQTETQGGAWIPATNSINEWVKFDFLEPRNLTGVITQGQKGGVSWVESFKVMYSHDGKVWNPVLGRDGAEKEFAANFDAETSQENYFDRPIQAQFLKIVPLTWHKNIAMRVEILGCFSPYPPVSTPVPPITTTITSESCTPCPNLPIERLENCIKCSLGMLWDGNNCVNKSECQCYVGHIPYSIGAVYKTEDCKECVCKIGGESSCHDIKCPKCENGMRAEKSPTCGCVCKPCPEGMRLCPTTEICINEERWCDGIEDCPDDEINCEVVTTPTVPTTPPTECFIPMCPPGYEPVLTTSTATPEFEESRSETKGVKGKKGFRDRLKAAKGKKNKITSICPVYECVPALTTTPKPCPIPECPPGYDVQILESPPAILAESCATFKCVLHPPEEEVCNMNGRSFETFDGLDYNYDICHHILTLDSINGKWSVEVHKNCSSCPYYLVIKQDRHTIILNKDILVKYGPYNYNRELASKIGYLTNQFEVSKVGGILHFKSIHYGFWVNWDGKSNARIGVSSKLLNSVSGLCGYYSNDRNDDRQMPDGSIARTNKQFGDSWAVEGYEICEPKVCKEELQNKAWEICELAKKKPFKMCSEVMDIGKFVSQCLETTCACLEDKKNTAFKEGIELELNWENECRCDALLNFATQCKEKEVSFDLSEWRIIHSCPALCPPGEVYKECYKRECEPSCRTLMMRDACPMVNDTCFSGCFCADGLIRKGDKCVEPVECRDCNCDCFGDPHYLTFDRSDYTFNGRCTYVAARDIKPGGKENHDFQVLAKNGECIEKTQASCTHALTILYGEHYIHLKRVEEDGEIAVIIDGTSLKKFPFINGWSKLEGLGGKEVTVLIPSIQLEVSYYFNNYAFVIRLPSILYGDGTEGLCGNCNKNKKDDFKKSDGSVTKDINDFGRSWLTKLPPELGFAEEKDCEVPVVPPCPSLPPEEDPCLKAIMDESRFGECHPVVSPTPYLEACSKDICHSKDKKKTVCHTMEAYARECAREGVCLEWNVDDLCPYECPAGLVYHPCGSGCLETCENHESFKNKSSLCSMSSIDGCYCPTGKVWKDDKCVEVTMCRACDEEGHFPGDVWNPSECEECSCTDSTLTCKVKSCPSVETVCDSSMTAIKVSESEDECCPTYTCVNTELVPPSPSPCDEPLKPKCGDGQELNVTTSISGCREYICVCVPLERCEPLLDPVTLKAELGDGEYDPGMKYEIDNTSCCPRNISICDKSLCSPPPECPVHHTVVELPTEESKCCPEYSCSLSGEVCMYESEYTSEEELETGAAWPIVSFKKLGEKWHDGPCKECTCVEVEEKDYSKGTKAWKGKVKGGRHLKKVFRASCETVRCPSVEEHLDSKNYLLKEVPVEGVCCPEIVRTACMDEGKIYQVGKEWSQPGQHCISHQCVLATNASLVIKQFKIRECETECDEGWEYQKPSPDSEKCCGQCKQVACMFAGKLQPIGSSWVSSDKCTTYYCREVDGLVQTQSFDVNCPKEERLYEDFKVEVLPIEGSCCNRTYKVACLIGEHELKEGETFVVSKCKKVYCALGEDGELSKQEVIETCNEECPKGWQYIEPVLNSEKCCGECKQVACLTEDNKLIPAGTKWTTNDGCTSHICERKGEQLQVSTFEEKCPSVDDCPPENVFFDKCCKRCNSTEKCSAQGICSPVDVEPNLTKGIVDENKDFHGRCLNLDPVPGFKECKGNCHSSTFFDLRTLTHQSNCKCCQATTTKSITVKVVCEDGYYYERKVTTPTGCACNTCESPEKIRNPTKSGTKTGYKPLILKDADA